MNADEHSVRARVETSGIAVHHCMWCSPSVCRNIKRRYKFVSWDTLQTQLLCYLHLKLCRSWTFRIPSWSKVTGSLGEQNTAILPVCLLTMPVRSQPEYVSFHHSSLLSLLEGRGYVYGIFASVSQLKNSARAFGYCLSLSLTSTIRSRNEHHYVADSAGKFI